METFRPEWGHNKALIAVGLVGRLNYATISVDKYWGLKKAWISPEIILSLLKYLGINMVHNKAKEKESWTVHIAWLYEAPVDTTEPIRVPRFCTPTMIKLIVTMKHQYMPWKKLRITSNYNLTNC